MLEKAGGPHPLYPNPSIRSRRDFGERTPMRPLRARPRTVKARPVKARQNPPLFYVSPTAPPIPHIAAQLRPLGMFTYNPIHQVIICHACRSCLVPGPRGQRRHVQAEPHRLMGAALQAQLQVFSGYQLRTVEQLQQLKPQPGSQCAELPHLESYEGLLCLQPACGFGTRGLSQIKKHMAAVHNIKAASHSPSQPLWRACQLQTYFTA